MDMDLEMMQQGGYVLSGDGRKWNKAWTLEGTIYVMHAALEAKSKQRIKEIYSRRFGKAEEK